jgi:hypothetical protein
MLRWEASSVSLRACPENRQVNILLRKPEFESRVFETKNELQNLMWCQVLRLQEYRVLLSDDTNVILLVGEKMIDIITIQGVY